MELPQSRPGTIFWDWAWCEPWRQTDWRLSSWTPPYLFLRWCRPRCLIGGRTSAPASRGCLPRVRSLAWRSSRGKRCGCSWGSAAFRIGIGTTCRTCFKFKWNDNGNINGFVMRVARWSKWRLICPPLSLALEGACCAMPDSASCSFWAWSALCLPICIVVPPNERWTLMSSPLIGWVTAWRRFLGCRWAALCLFWNLSVIYCILLIICGTIVEAKRLMLLCRCAHRSYWVLRSDIYILLSICCRKCSGFSHVLLPPSRLSPSPPKIKHIYR